MAESVIMQQGGNLMARYDELQAVLKDVKEPKRSFILSLLTDFVRLEADLEKLSGAEEYIINENNPREQIVLPIHKVIHDKQAQKNDIATKILRSLDGESGEADGIAKVLADFEAKYKK